MSKILIASKNPGKMREIKEIFSGLPFDILSLSDFGDDTDVKETGKTFEENAVLKARTIGRKTGLMTLADDSGLEVDALGGKPGIYSARYTMGTDEDRVKKVLKEMSGIPKKKRTARFIAVVALYNPQEDKVFTFRGESEGCITQKPSGKNGFGYDPIFYNFDLEKINAEASPAEKNNVSHRARALLKCRNKLLSLY